MIMRHAAARSVRMKSLVSDGAKSDSGNIQEIFGTENKVAVCDPVYPVYVDTNVMAGAPVIIIRKTKT